MAAQILIVEDQPELAALAADYVRAAGFGAQIIADGQAAFAAIRAQRPDLIVLDLMLPGLDGLSLCRQVRAFSDVPIVMVTARVEEIDRLIGLDSGADDYLCKPFSPRELVARIKAILRRTDAARPPKQRIEIDDAGRRIRIDGQALALTPGEFGLLAALVRQPGRIHSRTQLLDALDGDRLEVSDRAIDAHIKNLRRKLAQVLPGEEPIHSVYGLGYCFEL